MWRARPGYILMQDVHGNWFWHDPSAVMLDAWTRRLRLAAWSVALVTSVVVLCAVLLLR